MRRERTATARLRPAVLALGSALAVFAAEGAVPPDRSELADLSLEQLSNVVVTSVSRREERLSDAPASIYVITAQEIRGSGATTLPEVLRLAPNLIVARADAVQYAISARGFNNVLANKMLVLIDGRAIYTPLFSGVFWDVHDVFIEDIERIEVVSGPGATLWGANAVNGVINVITRPARDTKGLLAWAGHGNRETGGGARYGGELGDGHYRIYVKSSDRANSEREDGTDVRDSQQIAQAGFRADWNRANRSFTFQGDAYTGTVDQVGPSRELSGGNLLARWAWQLEGGATFNVQAWFDRTERWHPNSFRERLDTTDVEFQHGLRWGSAHSLLWGGGYRHARDEVEGSAQLAFMPPLKHLHWSNLFVQDQVALRPDLDLVLGGKIERNTYTGDEFLPSARLAWRISAGQLAWGSLSRAVRAPSRIDRELFVPANPPFILAGGPDFVSEVSNVAELGYRARPSESLSYSVTAFHHEHDKLRSIALKVGLPVFANDLKGHTSGVEAWARWQVVPSLAVSAGAVSMHQRLEVRAGGVDLAGQPSLGNDPETWAKLRASWTISPRHTLDVSMRYYGSLPNPPVPGYTAVDARLGWRVSREIELSLALQNLFDDKHAEWGPAANRSVFPRSAFLKLTWRP